MWKIIDEAEKYQHIVQKPRNKESGGSYLVALCKLRLLPKTEATH
jgi:hypothetical protein